MQRRRIRADTSTVTAIDLASYDVREPLVSALLRLGVPLTLLIDLADPSGPDSAAILAAERAAASVA